ncbi:hypothetical protein, partial [Frankia sp. Cj5]|uniref:hypothetical protein n=1 Tax=Frankia sp. Cj5 TaxID=2880978 RepID=UPI001EF4D1E6
MYVLILQQTSLSFVAFFVDLRIPQPLDGRYQRQQGVNPDHGSVHSLRPRRIYACSAACSL